MSIDILAGLDNMPDPSVVERWQIMSGMDALAELENMAKNIIDDFNRDQEPEPTAIYRWQRVFGYSRAEATKYLQEHRSNYTRERLSDDLWEVVRTAKESAGYYREAYEHEIEIRRAKTRRPAGRSGPSVSQASSRSTYIVKLEGPLGTAAQVQVAANLKKIPVVRFGAGEAGDADFVEVDTNTRDAIYLWLSQHNNTGFAPTIIRVSKSGKDLFEHSAYPTLGIDTTMPQYRADNSETRFLPAQNQYPVWYFFYGNLADPEILTRRLALSTPPVFVPATIRGGMIKRWHSKYNALLDADSTAWVNGRAYLVESEAHEDALRMYETENYEIVRCSISMGGDLVKGLTFRFAGPSEELS